MFHVSLLQLLTLSRSAQAHRGMSESGTVSDFVCLYLDDYCEEIEVEEHEEEDQSSCSQASMSAQSGLKRGRNTAAGVAGGGGGGGGLKS